MVIRRDSTGIIKTSVGTTFWCTCIMLQTAAHFAHNFSDKPLASSVAAVKSEGEKISVP